MKSWGLEVSSKGSNRAYVREQRALAKEMARQQKAEQKAEEYWREQERKLKLNDWKVKERDRIKSKAEQLKYKARLESKYGITRKKGRFNAVKSFFKYNKQVASSKIIARNAPNQFNARPLPQRSEKWNPFAHKSEMEVYGDEGLTLFDGNKMDDDDTGSLFGFGKRRKV